MSQVVSFSQPIHLPGCLFLSSIYWYICLQIWHLVTFFACRSRFSFCFKTSGFLPFPGLFWTSVRSGSGASELGPGASTETGPGDPLETGLGNSSGSGSNSQWAQISPECYMNVQFWSEYSGPIMNISAMFRS